MSKVDQLRMLREARYQSPPPVPVRREKPVTVVATPDSPAVPLAQDAGAAPARPSTQPPADVSTQPPARPSTRTGHGVPAGYPIGSYRDGQLQAVVRDIVERHPTFNDTAVLEAVMAELGFVRRGKVIRERITAALDTVRSQ